MLVSLRPIDPKDLEVVSQILLDETIRKTYMVPDLTRDAAIALASRFVALSRDENRYVRGIYAENTLVGWLNDAEISGNSLELGWVIHPLHQNNGYATAAVKTAIDDLFQKGFRKVIAGAFENNFASQRVMEKAGMTLQEQSENIEYRGKIHHCIFYAIENK